MACPAPVVRYRRSQARKAKFANNILKGMRQAFPTCDGTNTMKNKCKKFVHNAPVPKALEVSAMEAIMEQEIPGLESLGTRFSLNVKDLERAGIKPGINRLGDKLVLFGYVGCIGWDALLMERKEYREAKRLARAIRRIDPYMIGNSYWHYTTEDKHCFRVYSEELGYPVSDTNVRNNRLASEDRTRFLAMTLIDDGIV